jgi:O-succinylbenzoic acid--CoA ligase
MRDWLSHRVRTTPDATALIAAKTGDEWDYAALDVAVDRMAGRLAGLGVSEGDHLGVSIPPRGAYVSLVHAAMRLGATLVPLGADLTPRELAAQLETADVTTLVCAAGTEPTAVEAAGDVPVVSLDEPRYDDVASVSDAGEAPFEPAVWGLEDPVAMLFTSGTTGRPKAVVLRTKNLLASAVASAFRLGVLPDDRWLVTLSMHHMGGLAPVYRSVLYGTTLVLREGFEPGAAADDIGKYDVTGVSLVPTMLQQMLERRGTLADSLRVVLLGGAAAPRSLIERCRAYSVPVYPTYGMTETASQAATATPEEAFANEGTVGRPLLWTEFAVVDDDGEEVDPGELGELVVSGPTVTSEYYGDPDATADAFCSLGLRTGDVGYRDESGRLYVAGRVDDRIVTGGENVEPAEVVEVVRSHPKVRDAAVVGLPDEEWGERVGALVEPSDESLTAEELDDFCRERLAGYKIPRTVRFAESLPRTVSGTTERATVRERLLDGGPTDEGDRTNDAEPRGETERGGFEFGDESGDEGDS